MGDELAEQTQPEYQRQRLALEERLLQKPLDTFKPLEEIAWGLGFKNEAELIRYLRNKKVLDVGSGFNGLSIGFILKNVPADITSITLRKNDPRFERFIKELVRQEQEYKAYGRANQERAIKQSLQKTHALFAHSLSLLDDGSFDVVVDNFAVFQYAREEEVLVLRKGGKIRIGDYSGSGRYGQGIPNWKEEILIQARVDYKLINTPQTSGVEITK